MVARVANQALWLSGYNSNSCAVNSDGTGPEPPNHFTEKLPPVGTENKHKFFLQRLFEHPRGSGHPCKIPGTYQVPSKPKEDKLSREGTNFRPPPFAWKTPTPPGSLRTPKVNLCVLFSFLTRIISQTFYTKAFLNPGSYPRVCKPWFPNCGWRFPTKQRWNWG